MRSKNLLVVVLAGFLLSLSVTNSAIGQTEESRWGDEKESKSNSVVLTRRANNNAYGTSAFSFRKDSQDIAEHRNYVDLVFNGCGHFHFNPVPTDMQSRVADLGEQLDMEIDYDESEDKDRFWAEQSFPPQEGHVYLHMIKCKDQTMTVMYRINEVSSDEIKLDWKIVKELSGTEADGGNAGTMGQCGGSHPAR